MRVLSPTPRPPEEQRVRPPPPSSAASEARTLAPIPTPRSPFRQRWIRINQRFLAQLPFLLIMILATYLITFNIASPWQSVHEDNGTLNESIALNHLRFGLGVTKGQDLLDIEAKQSFGPPHVSEAQHFAYFRSAAVHPQVYGDHPPLLGLTIAGSFLLFGPHYWSERLVPIIYALAGLLVFYILVSQVFDRAIARFASFLYATFPMMAYFGRNVSHEAPTLFWGMLLLLAYTRWRAQGHSRWLVVMGVATGIGGSYGWPLFYFVVLLFAIDWWANRRPSRALALATVVPAALVFLLVMAQIAWAFDGDLSRLGSMFLHRTSGSDESSATVTTLEWFSQITNWNAEGFGGWTQIGLPVAIFFLATHASAERWSPRVGTLMILAAWGVSHILIFRNGAFVHAYWQFYLLPFYALIMAWTIVTLARERIARGRLRALVLIIAGGAAFNLGLASIISLYSTGYHTILPVVPLFDVWH